MGKFSKDNPRYKGSVKKIKIPIDTDSIENNVVFFADKKYKIIIKIKLNPIHCKTSITKK